MGASYVDQGDIQIGNVLQPGASGLTSRMGQFMAELPYDIPLSTVNRQCSSSLQATANIAAFIKAGVIDVGLAGGVENMSMLLGFLFESLGWACVFVLIAVA